MLSNRVGADVALDLLRQRSQAEKRNLRAVADDIVAEAARDDRA